MTNPATQALRPARISAASRSRMTVATLRRSFCIGMTATERGERIEASVVLLLNDYKTPMEFVVRVLESICPMGDAQVIGAK